ncbi:MAG: hypothetical protein NVSMB3_15470 [Acidobacteriaceae bacterium]
MFASLVLVSGVLPGTELQGQCPEARGVSATATPAAVSSGGALVTYRFARPGLVVPRFQISIREDGTGRYTAEEVPPGTQMGPGQTVVAEPSAHVEREITVTPATAAKIFKMARSEHEFRIQCASKAKNIADTGLKTLSYEGPDGKGSCTYNYTENKNIGMLTELFHGIATTLDEGRKLEFKRRYDRLGLDAELDLLTQASDTGRAVELGTIAPLLRQLAGDTEMMQRVRSRSAKLLDRAADGR